jgi:hypothetical protein
MNDDNGQGDEESSDSGGSAVCHGITTFRTQEKTTMRATARERRRRTFVNQAGEHFFVGSIAGEEKLINFAGNYDYLSAAYYVSQDHENEGKPILPTCKEMLDAYVPPLFLEKAELAQVAVPQYYISNGFFEPPVIVDPINPFTLKGRIVLKPGRVKSIARSLTRSNTYAVCCQELPPGSRVAYFHSILGWSAQASYRGLSQVVWDVFRIPLARVRVVRLENDENLLSDISPLFFEDLGARELDYLEERVTWGS